MARISSNKIDFPTLIRAYDLLINLNSNKLNFVIKELQKVIDEEMNNGVLDRHEPHL